MSQSPLKPMKLVGITGKMRSGKDTFFNNVSSILWHNHTPRDPRSTPVRFAFADSLKERFVHSRGITRDYLEANKDVFRNDLQAYGHERRRLNATHWIEELVLSPRWKTEEGWRFITDVRYINEADFVRQNGGIIVRITGSSTADTTASLHPSETEQGNIRCDYEVLNTGSIQDFRNAIISFLPTLTAVCGGFPVTFPPEPE